MKITVIDRDGVSHSLDALEGWRVMEIIRDHGLPIKAECGGACACATCHVMVDPAFQAITGQASAMEESMLDFASERQETSRLSCQITLSDELDGLVVRLPQFQG